MEIEEGAQDKLDEEGVYGSVATQADWTDFQ